MKKRVTMQDIANRLNLSKNTVSQALSGKPGVSEETRRLIEKTAEEMGYSYHKYKRSSVASGKGNIGLIASDFAFSFKDFFGEIYLAIEEETRKQGLNLLIQSINKEARDHFSLPAFIEEKTVDGILILSHITNAYIQKVISQGIPVVTVDHHDPSIDADAVLTNNRFGAYTAVEHLIQMGHKDIAFIGEINLSPSYQERLEGYRLALQKHGIQENPDFFHIDVKDEEEFVEKALSSLSSFPSAWFCANDRLGFLVVSSLQKRGIAVPDQVSVVSFDNGLLSRLSTPKITSVDIDLRLFGRKSVEQLLWRINHPHEPHVEILLPTKLIRRESVSMYKK
ncbi:Transcriptional regulator [[Clostridium] ultunense Esp]|uniref:LacI family DNA-binding transcriptional regulator n=1 Tax=Thermicanus aegyptius TaxID=94009 RepID=UPI0002B70C7D|nr:LacI family DNA-binding transcriptional regulator [Thermicanus aegyptius]CCQ96130.1 Transcriptional regulator [[Clostridium] ultunense Esp]